jgi:hypothetical protein
MNKLREAKANIAVAHSLLETICAMLKTDRAYQQPEPEQMQPLQL